MPEVWNSVYAACATIVDARVERTRQHSLSASISIALCAVMCGADVWVAVETFCNAKQAWWER